MVNFTTEEEMFGLMKKELYTSVICDILDDFGYRNQAMNDNIRPIDPENIIAGKAKTCLAVDVYKIYENPYEIEIQAIDSLKKNEVFIATTNNSKQNVLWGELLSTAAKARGAVGAIIDGLIRDVKQINNIKFPVFSTGFKPLDSKGRGYVIDYDCPIECGGVKVNPGDIIFADYDGIVVIPKVVAKKVIEAALEKVTKENSIREELENGSLLAEIYKKYGIL